MLGTGGLPPHMEFSPNRREWLEWLTRVRLLMIALILGVGVVLPQYVPSTGSTRFFLPIIILASCLRQAGSALCKFPATWS